MGQSLTGRSGAALFLRDCPTLSKRSSALPRRAPGLIPARRQRTKVTEGLLARFGAERVRETPISEAGFVGAAVGMAMTGWHPVAELIFMDFAWVAGDQISNQAQAAPCRWTWTRSWPRSARRAGWL
jgi:hypothetical protein